MNIHVKRHLTIDLSGTPEEIEIACNAVREGLLETSRKEIWADRDQEWIAAFEEAAREMGYPNPVLPQGPYAIGVKTFIEHLPKNKGKSSK